MKVQVPFHACPLFRFGALAGATHGAIVGAKDGIIGSLSGALVGGVGGFVTGFAAVYTAGAIAYLGVGAAGLIGYKVSFDVLVLGILAGGNAYATYSSIKGIIEANDPYDRAASASDLAYSLVGWGLIVRSFTAPKTFTSTDAVAQGLVRPGGRLNRVLEAIEAEYGAKQPSTQDEAMGVIEAAVRSVDMEPGQSIGALPGQGNVVLRNVNTVTTVKPNGEIIVRNAQDQIVLHLIPK